MGIDNILEYLLKMVLKANGVLAPQGTTAHIYSGNGSPEGTAPDDGTGIVAGLGSIYLRTDGGTSTSLYVKQTGSNNQGWVAK